MVRPLLLIILLLNATAFAKPPAERKQIKTGTEITVSRYYEDSDTVEVVMNKEEAVGPNYATIEALKGAISTDLSVSELRKQVARNSGTIYVLSAALPLLWEQEVFHRQKHHPEIK